MNMRAQVHMNASGLFLFMEKDVHDLPKVVQNALAKKTGWYDEPRLARIIFNEMVENAKQKGWDRTTGSNTVYKDIGFSNGSIPACHQCTVIVNTICQIVTVQRGHHGVDDVIWRGSFEEFINADMSRDAVMH